VGNYLRQSKGRSAPEDAVAESMQQPRLPGRTAAAALPQWRIDPAASQIRPILYSTACFSNVGVWHEAVKKPRPLFGRFRG
jgi:hypothetical protein